MQEMGSPGWVVVPVRSPLSVNGRDVIAVASTKLSLAGGDADAALGPADTISPTTATTIEKRGLAWLLMVAVLLDSDLSKPSRRMPGNERGAGVTAAIQSLRLADLVVRARPLAPVPSCWAKRSLAWR